MNRILNFINGSFHSPVNNQWIDNYNPSNGEVYGLIPNSTKEDVDNAYIAAKSAFPNWSQTTLDERSRILIRISELIESNLDRFAEAESKDNGKPLALARAVDIPRAAANFRFFANAITQFASESHESLWDNKLSIILCANRLGSLDVYRLGTFHSISLRGKSHPPLLLGIV